MRLTLNAVLEISRLESGFVTPEYEKLDVNQLLSELFEQHVSIANEKGLEFRFCVPAKQVPIYVKTDRVLLTRILTNLISNALKYTLPKKNQISGVILGLVRLGTTIQVNVVDTGLGIDELHRNAIFQPFFQISNRERDREKGLGLGLSIVAEMVSLLDHHRLDFTSYLGRGTRFSLNLPLAQDRDNLSTIAISNKEAEEVEAISLLDVHILLVEDDLLVRKSMCAILESRGMTVTDCGDFDEVLDFLRNTAEIPDLILTDFRLPDSKTAIDVIEAIKTELECNIPTIVMSGEVTSLKSVQHLATQILTKPVDSAVLMSTIRRVHSAVR
jgi:two-component system, sensor histidine kinase